MEYWDLEYVRGHLVVSGHHGRYLLDTGSPVSFLFTRSNPETESLGVGKQSGVTLQPEIAACESRIQESVRAHVAEDIDALIGMDVLGEFDAQISVADSAIRLSSESIAPFSELVLPTKSLSGCPLVAGISIGGEEQDLIWDTGAHLSYIADGNRIAGLPGDGRVTDFHPFSNQSTIEVETVRAPLTLGDRTTTLNLRVAAYPAFLPDTGFDILGSELAEHYDAHLSMRQGFLALRQRHEYQLPTVVRTSLGVPEVREMIGKRVKDIVWKKNGARKPAHQFFVIFDDDTYYEIYSAEHLCPAGGVDIGGVEATLEYVHKFEEKVE